MAQELATPRSCQQNSSPLLLRTMWRTSVGKSFQPCTAEPHLAKADSRSVKVESYLIRRHVYRHYRQAANEEDGKQWCQAQACYSVRNADLATSSRLAVCANCVFAISSSDDC